ncbi:MAG: 50S ribosomal protein L25, partial [Treponemataceae bacterium]|nr:50S ribosomal protein L25 [Treponemataceae bacterium]
MEQLVINAKARTTTGKAEAKRMRKQGVLPAVLYNSEG